MKQINGEFEEYYYLTDDCIVYNAETGQYIKPDNKHQYKLKTTDNEYKKVSQRTLYKEVYNKHYCKDNTINIDNEEWKEIVGTEGKYYISNQGRIKSYQGYEAIILRPYSNKSGYLRVDIKEDGKRQSKLVHRLVAAAWLPMPERLDLQLHHKDFNKNNNAADNLEFLAAAEHMKKHREKGKINVGAEPEENIH